MPTCPMAFAQTNLPDLVARAKAAEEVILAGDKGPVVRLVPVPRGTASRRRAGRLEGLITVGPEFFEPLPDDELKEGDG